MSNKLKLGVVGLGNIFKYLHAPAWLAHPEVQLTALCDENQELLEALGKQYGVTRLYRNYREMIEYGDIDIIDICAPNLYHSEVSIVALRAGKHVFCEKPDAINPSEAQMMADAANASGKILMTMRNNRFRPASRFLKKYIENGQMGEIYTGRCGWVRRRGMAPVGWFTNKALSGGGPLIDLGVHFIDLAVWLMGNPAPVAVVGATYNKFGEKHLEDSIRKYQGLHPNNLVYDVEDLAIGFIRFANGASMQIEFSWASNIEDERNFLELRGTKAGCTFDKGVLNLFSETDGVLCDIHPKLPPDIPGHSEHIGHFVDCVLHRDEPMILPEHGVEMIKILSAIYESARTGSEVKL